MGELPSQQPPDWWNITGPCASVRRRSRSAASPVTSTWDPGFLGVELVGITTQKKPSASGEYDTSRFLVCW